MKRSLIMLVLIGALAAASAAVAQQNALHSHAYRAQASIQLSVSFQGLAEGQLSRGLRLFGARGHCQAWYTITEVIRTPAGLDMRRGDRLNLHYRCGQHREFVSASGATLPWALARGAYATVWLRSSDIEPKRFRTWIAVNADNLFAPVGVEASSKPATKN